MKAILIKILAVIAGPLIIAAKDIFLTFTGRWSEKKRRKAQLNTKKRILNIILQTLKWIAIIIAIILVYTQVIKKTKYQVETGIYYSSGDQNNWDYVNQQKEYSIDKPCYLRFSTTINSDNWRGNRKKVGVKLIFDTVGVADIILVDGLPINIENESNGQVSYEFEVDPSNHKELVTVFQYEPKNTGSVSVEVQYDNSISSTYNTKSTIFFVE